MEVIDTSINKRRINGLANGESHGEDFEFGKSYEGSVMQPLVL